MESSSQHRIVPAAVILTGGESRRMGVSKAELPVGPETMLARAVRLLGTVAQPVVLAAAHGDRRGDLPKGVLVSRDSAPDRGPLEGLASAFDLLAAQETAPEIAIVVGCDAPRLVPAVIGRLAQHLADNPVIDAVTVEHQGRDYPLLAAYRVAVRATARQLLDRDQRRLRDLMAAVHTQPIDAETLRPLDPELASLENVNTPDDYLRTLAVLGFDAPPEIMARFQRDEP